MTNWYRNSIPKSPIIQKLGLIVIPLIFPYWFKDMEIESYPRRHRTKLRIYDVQSAEAGRIDTDDEKSGSPVPPAKALPETTGG